jgi:hypothetical protein
LIEFDIAVSFGIIPRVLFRTKYDKTQKIWWIIQSKNEKIEWFFTLLYNFREKRRSIEAREIDRSLFSLISSVYRY